MVKKKRLLISVKEARKLLGKSSENLTKEEIEKLIANSEQMTRFVIQQYLVRKSEVLK